MNQATKSGRVISLAAVVSVLVSAPVLAGAPDLDDQWNDQEWGTLPGKGHRYSVLDSNRDGRYSLEEIRATHPNLTQKEFADFDANLDGRVTRDELRQRSNRPGGRLTGGR